VSLGSEPTVQEKYFYNTTTPPTPVPSTVPSNIEKKKIRSYRPFYFSPPHLVEIFLRVAISKNKDEANEPFERKKRIESTAGVLEYLVFIRLEVVYWADLLYFR
jgi:hypothetical protein